MVDPTVLLLRRVAISTSFGELNDDDDDDDEVHLKMANATVSQIEMEWTTTLKQAKNSM